MTLSELDKKILMTKHELKTTRKTVSRLNGELLHFSDLREKKLMDAFFHFMEVGSIIKFQRDGYLKPEQIFIKKTGQKKISYFKRGCQVQIIKKNKKSFVVKTDDGMFWNIKLNNLYFYLTSIDDFQKSLVNFIKRTENLEKIFES
jgi:hypothetical protein